MGESLRDAESTAVRTGSLCNPRAPPHAIAAEPRYTAFAALGKPQAAPKAASQFQLRTSEPLFAGHTTSTRLASFIPNERIFSTRHPGHAAHIALPPPGILSTCTGKRFDLSESSTRGVLLLASGETERERRNRAWEHSGNGRQGRSSGRSRAAPRRERRTWRGRRRGAEGEAQEGEHPRPEQVHGQEDNRQVQRRSRGYDGLLSGLRAWLCLQGFVR